VVVTEHLLTVACPDIFPNFWRIDTNAVDEPLGVIVQGDLDKSASVTVMS